MIYLLLINSFAIFGVYASTRDGMILEFVNNFATKWICKAFFRFYKDPEIVSKKATFILKPLFDCPPCMASIWGLPFALLHPLSIWPLVYLFALSGFNYVIMKLINR
jgi:hypothetical protein